MIKQYVLYDAPEDYPASFVIREWAILPREIMPLGITFKSINLSEVLFFMDQFKLNFIRRSDEDTPSIVGVWI